MSADLDQPLPLETMLISPGELRLSDRPSFRLEQLDAATALSRIYTVLPTMQVPMKTFGPDRGEIHYNDGSGSIAELSDVMVTLMRLTNPNTGFVSLHMSLEYFATSKGSRTPDGRSLPGSTTYYNAGREAYRINHSLYFRNAAGGLVYGWYVGQDFELVCGWNRQHRLHGKIETDRLDWFDAVENYNWDVGGAFYRC
jgi:hypothetical protein